ncbi:unnamed protein product [Chrysoparadoxa australica]
MKRKGLGAMDLSERHSSLRAGGSTRLRKTFEAMDINCDGRVDFLDLKAYFLRQEKLIPDAELRDWVRARDREGLGYVTFDDFCRSAKLRRER